MPIHEGALDKTAIQSLVGLSATDTIGFYGTTPVAQAAAVTSISTSAAVSGAFGFTSAQANGIITSLNSLITALHNLGLIG